MTLTYVYCLVRAARRPSVSRIQLRIPGGGPIRTLDAGDGCWVVVSDVPAEEYDEAAIARGLQDMEWLAPRALAHQAVVERFLRAPAVLPMPLFTIFTSDDRAVRVTARSRPRLERVFDRIARKLEWGVRLTLDESRLRARTRSSGARAPEGGLAYLRRKRDQLEGTRGHLARARTEGNRLYRSLAQEATAAVRRSATERSTPGSRLVVDAAFLVPADRTAAFRAAVRRQARQLDSSGLVLSLTGPWPPYTFVGGRLRGRQS